MGERGWRIKGEGGGSRLFGWNRVLAGALLSRGDLILIYSRVPNKLVFAVVTSLPPHPPLPLPLRHHVCVYIPNAPVRSQVRRAFNATLSSFGPLGPASAPVETILDLCLLSLRLSCRAQTDRYTKEERERERECMCICVCVYVYRLGHARQRLL